MHPPALGFREKSRRWPRRGIRRAAIVLGLLLVCLAADYAGYPRFAPVGGRTFNTGRNAVWLQDTYYRGSAAEPPDALAARLTRQQMAYAYFHVRFVKKNGTLRYRENADTTHRLLDAVRSRAPNNHCVAWIYVGNARGITGVDLGDPTVRGAMVQEARWLVETCGFDGVQWDYEICADGDANLLSLLTETRAALPPNALLCVSSPMWLPAPLHDWGWSEAYFARVAALCDQIAVMCYDSGLYLPRGYVWLMQQQAVRVTRSVAQGNPNCRVLLGIPTYEDGGASHHAYAENISLALKGVREGLAAPGANVSVFAGVAVFSDATTDGAEWQTYQNLWLK